MKIIVIADIHFGVRSDSELFRKKHQKLFDNIAMYYSSHKSELNDVFILGDVFDKRKTIDFRTMENAIININKLINAGAHVHIIVGNHDSYYKNTLKLNSPSLIFGGNEYVTVYSNPCEYNGICMIPWICDDNYTDCMNIIKESKSDICFGHFELKGFQYNKSTVSTNGMDSDFLSKFKTVLTGHYHLKSHSRNVWYLGSPIQMNWDDYNQTKGFHVFDTDTHELEFIENDDVIYTILNYGDKLPDCHDKIIRLTVDGSIPKKDVDKYVNKINEMNPSDLKVMFSNNKEKKTEQEKVNCVDTKQSIVNFSTMYIDDDMSEDRMKKVINEVYNEALNLE